jgi:hypothetical protein
MANLSDFLPSASGGGGGGYKNMVKYITSTTVTPSTDLGLEDGATIGYFLCGGGDGGAKITDAHRFVGGFGGRIKKGTITISNASEAITITVGAGGAGGPSSNVVGSPGGASSIGSTSITTISSSDSDANSQSGWGAFIYKTSYWPAQAAGAGIDGYGAGGAVNGYTISGGSNGATSADGWGHGGIANSTYGRGFDGGNGAVILYY